MMPEEGTLPLAGRVAIVTGSSSGIGRAIAAELAGRGMTVVVTSRSQQRADATAAEIEEEGGTALGVAVELTDEGGPAALVERALGAFGRVDVLVNNAGAGQVAASETLAPGGLAADHRPRPHRALPLRAGRGAARCSPPGAG